MGLFALEFKQANMVVFLSSLTRKVVESALYDVFHVNSNETCTF